MNTDSDIPLKDMFGIGVDIAEIRRFRNLDVKSPFFNKVFTQQEIDYCLSYSDPTPHLAAIFTGKEAVIKALGGRSSVSMQSIEVMHDEKGAPHVRICHLPELQILLSLAHSNEHAVAAALMIPPFQAVNITLYQNSLNERISEFELRA